MITKALQVSGTLSQKKAAYQQIVLEASTKPKEIEHQISSFPDLNDLAARLTSISFGLTVELILNAFCIETCFSYLDRKPDASEGLIKLLKSTLAQKCPNKFSELACMSDRMSTIEKQLVILSGLAEFCPQEISEQQLLKFLPTFIRISSLIITKYLQLKNEPAKDKSDRIECDKIILENCEKQVAHSLTVCFGNLSCPHDPQVRHMTLLCLGDTIGACLESIRESILHNSILEGLLENVLMKYLHSVYPYEQIYDVYIKQLQSARFANPVQKVMIPQAYSSTQQLNTQAFGYITLSYLSTHIYSLNKQLQYLVAAASQNLVRPYEVKLPLIQKLLMVMDKLKIITIQNGNQLNYPVTLLLFNFHCHGNEHYERVKKHFQYASRAVETYSLLSLKFVDCSTLTPQINNFLLKWLDEHLIEEPNMALILREIGRDGPVNKKNYQILKSICHRLPQKYLDALIDEWQQTGVTDQQTLASLHLK